MKKNQKTEAVSLMLSATLEEYLRYLRKISIRVQAS